jgi:hypothetical protein
MYVTDKLEIIAVFLANNGPIAILEEMAYAFMPPVEINSVCRE